MYFLLVNANRKYHLWCIEYLINEKWVLKLEESKIKNLKQQIFHYGSLQLKWLNENVC
jgi:hypothetical protein